jgi:hypothetical protein
MEMEMEMETETETDDVVETRAACLSFSYGRVSYDIF